MLQTEFCVKKCGSEALCVIKMPQFFFHQFLTYSRGILEVFLAQHSIPTRLSRGVETCLGFGIICCFSCRFSPSIAFFTRRFLENVCSLPSSFFQIICFFFDYVRSFTSRYFEQFCLVLQLVFSFLKFHHFNMPNFSETVPLLLKFFQDKVEAVRSFFAIVLETLYPKRLDRRTKTIEPGLNPRLLDSNRRVRLVRVHLVRHLLSGRHELGETNIASVGGDCLSVPVNIRLLYKWHPSDESRHPPLAPLWDLVGFGEEPSQIQ